MIILKNYIIDLIRQDRKFFLSLPETIEVLDTDTGEIIKLSNPLSISTFFYHSGWNPYNDVLKQIWAYMDKRTTITNEEYMYRSIISRGYQ